MNNERVEELATIIENAFRELLEMYGEDYINGYIVGGNFNLYTMNNKKTGKIDIYRSGNDE